MNEVVNKFLLADGKFLSDMHLCQLDLPMVLEDLLQKLLRSETI